MTYWRDPDYIVAKFMLNIVGGLLIGFSFFKTPSTQQGTQNKLFSIFMATMITGPGCLQLQTIFIRLRTIYEIRERPRRMYTLSALVTSQILVESPWNMLSSFIFFVGWYWTMGLPNARASFTLLMYCVAFPLYTTTLAQASAAMAPSVEMAGLVFMFLFSFVITFNGVLQPFSLLGWWQWMYRLSPFTYIIEAILGQAIGNATISCSDVEYVVLQPPSGRTCGRYMNGYISFAGGYLLDPEAAKDCRFCTTRTTDEYLATMFNINYLHHWRNFGIVMAFVAFNTSAVYMLSYIFANRKKLLGVRKSRSQL
ncbi:hypothetical protein HGRIS_003146 [Hohenbuehelia grisea]|uniref:ABC-2 type transporter domain-containing protein n=1 Tax=Hohenbuehelia grisea TaxID=104357 RepID=A0ABR3JNY8_9AGAR